MFKYKLAVKFFEGFSILRWNDRLRPIEFVEMDHHALKSAVTFFLGKAAEDNHHPVNWNKIVNGNVFDLMRKISTSDMHSKVREKIQEEAAGALNNMICLDWEKRSIGLLPETYSQFEAYVNCGRPSGLEADILTFAHRYATSREFAVVEQFNKGDPDIETLNHEVSVALMGASQLPNLKNIKLVKDIIGKNQNEPLNRLLKLIERLRYQTRWGQTPRVPATSVLGHSMYVAVLTYFASVEAELEPERIVENFFAALFHDFPEILTRDIISPVKNATPEIKQVISDIEREECEESILRCLSQNWIPDVRFLMGLLEERRDNIWVPINGISDTEKDNFKTLFGEHREFSNRYRDESGIHLIEWGREPKDARDEYNDPMSKYAKCSGVDGKLLKICDSISAFMESRQSTQHGLHSPHLEQGYIGARAACEGKRIYKLHVDDFFDGIVY